MAVDLTATYTVTAPAGMDGRGEIAVLNDPASANFVGYLIDSSGFDSPEVREGGVEDLPEQDGGVHGTFYYGRRPFTMEIQVAIAATNALSMARLDKLYRATNAMRGDGTIAWTEGGTVAKQLTFRRQQPLRGPSVERSCLFAGVSADPRIYSGGSEITGTAGTSLSLVNNGNAGTPPRFTVVSPSATCVFTNTTTGEALTLAGLDGSGTLTVDFKARTVTRGGVNKYSKVSWPSSVWWELIPGTNGVTVTNTATPFYRSAWI